MWFYFFWAFYSYHLFRSLAVQCDKMLDHFRLRHVLVKNSQVSQCGGHVHWPSRIRKTRILFVTEGILLRRLESDPEVRRLALAKGWGWM